MKCVGIFTLNSRCWGDSLEKPFIDTKRKLSTRAPFFSEAVSLCLFRPIKLGRMRRKIVVLTKKYLYLCVTDSFVDIPFPLNFLSPSQECFVKRDF